MAKYLLIESRDPLESNEVGHFYETAAGLAQNGNEVTLFLVQNGVFPARPGPAAGAVGRLTGAGVQVLADDFSLRERGIRDLARGVKAAPLETVIDHLAEGRKAIWH